MQMTPKIVIGVGIVTIVFAVMILSGMNANPIDTKTGINNPPVITNTTISGDKINVYLGTIGNITFNATIPKSPASLRVYKGEFQPGDLIEVFPESSKHGGNVPSEEDAPLIAKQVLENYGGLPPDALLMGASTTYQRLLDRTTLNVVDTKPLDTSVSWYRKIDGKRIVGGGDSIQVLLGDNGAPLWIYKRWRTYTPLGNVTIIPVEKAIEKLGKGDVINPPSGSVDDVYVYGITLGYYVKGIEKPEVTLEPVWIFSGNTSDSSVMFPVYARQFANFTATPTSGKAPLTVTFTDTSDASPTKWNWNFGDGTTATNRNPAHTYTTAGSYNVSLRAWNDLGSDTMIKTNYITVRLPTPPVANFTVSLRTGTAPLSVTFNDTSTNAPAQWSWTFGDGGTSTDRNPVHVYTTAGKFTVALKSTNEDGSDTMIRKDCIAVYPPKLPPVHNDTATGSPG